MSVANQGNCLISVSSVWYGFDRARRAILKYLSNSIAKGRSVLTLFNAADRSH